MHILIQRFDANKYCTRSRAYVDGVLVCVFLELPLQPLVVGGLRALVDGEYQVIVNKSNRLSLAAGRDVFTPLILDLPGHTTIFNGKPLNECGIRQHSGNVVNSIPQGQPGGPAPGPYNVNDPNRTDVIGCMIAGTGFGAGNRSTVNSRIAMAKYQPILLAAQNRREAITLTVITL